MACKIRCNDEVIVLTGKDKGVRGKVKSILFGGKKAIVVGINLVKKHQKPIPVSNELGGILTKETKIDISNLAIFNIDTKKPDRVGFIFKHGRKIRIFKSNGKIIK